MNLKNKLNGNIIMAVILLMGTTVYFVEALKLPIFITPCRPGAGIFPLMLAAVMYIASSVVLARGIRQERKSLGWNHFKSPFFIIALIGLYVVSFVPFGYFATTFLFSFGIALLFSKDAGGSKLKMLVVPVIIAVTVTLVGYLFYEVIFDIRLPRGAW